MSLLDLNKEQQRAFNRLKKANADCIRLNVLLVNEYGTMTAYDKDLVESHGDDEIIPTGHPVKYTDVKDRGFYNINIFDTCPGMADDESFWYLGLTDKGLEIYENE